MPAIQLAAEAVYRAQSACCLCARENGGAALRRVTQDTISPSQALRKQSFDLIHMVFQVMAGMGSRLTGSFSNEHYKRQQGC